jgi:hypothetical protein
MATLKHTSAASNRPDRAHLISTFLLEKCSVVVADLDHAEPEETADLHVGGGGGKRDEHELVRFGLRVAVDGDRDGGVRLAGGERHRPAAREIIVGRVGRRGVEEFGELVQARRLARRQRPSGDGDRLVRRDRQRHGHAQRARRGIAFARRGPSRLHLGQLVCQHGHGSIRRRARRVATVARQRVRRPKHVDALTVVVPHLSSGCVWMRRPPLVPDVG